MSHSSLIPSFSSIGFRFGRDADNLGHKLKSLCDFSTLYHGTESLSHLIDGDGYRLWIDIGEAHGLRFVTEATQESSLVVLWAEDHPDGFSDFWLLAPNADLDGDSVEPLAQIRVQTPHPWFSSPIESGIPYALRLTLIAEEIGVFTDPEEYLREVNESGLVHNGIRCVGIEVEPGSGPRNWALVAGQVIAAKHMTNDLTASHFWHCTIALEAGPLTVALPAEALNTSCVGTWIICSGVLTGSIENLLPEPLPEESLTSDLKDHEVESKIRQYWRNFTHRPEFEEFVYAIHPHLPSILGGTPLRQLSKTDKENARRIEKLFHFHSDELQDRYAELSENGMIVIAPIVMANTAILESGESSAALVVIGFGEGVDEVMHHACSVLKRVHFDFPETPEEQELAALIEDEEYHFGRRRKLPQWLVGNLPVYAVDLWVPSQALMHETLQIDVLVCFAEAGGAGLTSTIPGDLIKLALNDSRGPSSPPPVPQAPNNPPPPPPPPPTPPAPSRPAPPEPNPPSGPRFHFPS